MLSWSKLVSLADLVGGPPAADDPVETITPVRFANIVALNDQGQRVVVRMRWGLVPPWAPDSLTTKHIHARSETIDTKRAFRDAFEHRRGLLFVSTFNEGEEISATKTQQYVLTPKDGEPAAIAVIWERWLDPNAGALLTFAMVTTPPNPLIETITDRMPALLPEADWPKWLGEDPASLDELKALLRTSDRDLDMQRAGKPPPPPKQKKPREPDSQPDLF